MNQYMPPHKHVGDEGKPGQIINPINTDIMDEMMNLPASVQHMHRTGFTPDMPQTQTPAVTAANRKPAHGGYPTPAPFQMPEPFKLPPPDTTTSTHWDGCGVPAYSVAAVERIVAKLRS
jgi:hypothetical protein